MKITINNNAPRLKSPKSQNRRVPLGRPANLLEWFYSSSLSKIMLSAMAKALCFNIQVIKCTFNSIPVVEKGVVI